MYEVDVGDFRIAFERRGTGPPLVLLHGALADSRSWRRQLDALFLLPESASVEVIAETAAIMSDFHPAGMRAMLHAFAEADLRDVLPTIDVPTLLLYGDTDQRSPLHVARDLHARIPTATLVVMPGVGHVGNVEAPETFNSEVRRFLTSNWN